MIVEVANEIPIQNLYYLLCYAWDQLAEGSTIDIHASDEKSLTELFARVLAHGTQLLVKRGFDRDYVAHTEETSRLRGRLNLSASLQRLSWKRNHMVCEFDELDHNIIHNQILATTIRVVLAAEGIEGETRELLREQASVLHGIDSFPITKGLFRRVRLHRNNRFYRFLLNVCELIYDSKLPEQRDGVTQFRDFIRDPKQMPGVFEKFVRNFYRQEQQGFTVGRIQLQWQAEGPPETLAVLPMMQTDVSLWSRERSLILDCKFYSEAMDGWLGSEKLHASNLYQIYAYVRNAEFREGWANSEGVLLYPSVSSQLDYDVRILGHRIQVVSVDLSLPWTDIHNRLIQIIADLHSDFSTAGIDPEVADGEL